MHVLGYMQNFMLGYSPWITFHASSSHISPLVLSWKKSNSVLLTDPLPSRSILWKISSSASLVEVRFHECTHTYWNKHYVDTHAYTQYTYTHAYTIHIPMHTHNACTHNKMYTYTIHIYLCIHTIYIHMYTHAYTLYKCKVPYNLVMNDKTIHMKCEQEKV